MACKEEEEELLEDTNYCTYIGEGEEDVLYTRNKNCQRKEKELFYRTCGRLKYCITEKGVFLKKEKTA